MSKNTEAVRELPREQDWITREASRANIAAPATSESARFLVWSACAEAGQLAALESKLKELDAKLHHAQARPGCGKHRAAQQPGRQLLGLQAAELLMARTPEFETAATELLNARAQLKKTESAREAAKTACNRRASAWTESKSKPVVGGAEERNAREASLSSGDEAAPCAWSRPARLLRLRSKRRGMPAPGWSLNPWPDSPNSSTV